MAAISVVLTAYNRCHQTLRSLDSIRRQRDFEDIETIIVDDGSTDDLGDWLKEDCYSWVRYIRMDREGWKNMSLPFNVGIRAATADLIVMQSAEVRYMRDDSTLRFREYLKDDKLWVLANVRGEISPGGAHRDLCSTTRNWPGAFFCSGLHRRHLLKMRGFDEDYVLAGHDDDDLAFRLMECLGLKQVFVNDIRAEHQWHEPAPYKAENREMYERKKAETRAGRMSWVRNVGRPWGIIP